MTNLNMFILTSGIIISLFTLCIIAKIISHIVIKSPKRFEYDISSVPLTHVVDYKEQMDGEKTTNHQFDETKVFPDKLDAGSDSLEKFKREHGISICKSYRMG